MNKKHGITNVRCAECGQEFSDSSTLERHTASHVKIVVCSECKEVFTSKDSLKEHMKVHLNCYICKRSCDLVKQLNRHIYTHK